MQIYTDEFLDAVEIIEEDLMRAVQNWSKKINNDFMVECRDVCIGDITEFEDGFSVKMETYSIDILKEIKSLSRRHVDDVSNDICKQIETTLQNFVEDKIRSYDGHVNRITNIRKMVKIVLDSDILIDYHNNRQLLFKFGIDVYEKK